jgi:hypothetical protein
MDPRKVMCDHTWLFLLGGWDMGGTKLNTMEIIVVIVVK